MNSTKSFFDATKGQPLRTQPGRLEAGQICLTVRTREAKNG